MAAGVHLLNRTHTNTQSLFFFFNDSILWWLNETSFLYSRWFSAKTKEDGRKEKLLATRTQINSRNVNNNERHSTYSPSSLTALLPPLSHKNVFGRGRRARVTQRIIVSSLFLFSFPQRWWWCPVRRVSGFIDSPEEDFWPYMGAFGIFLSFFFFSFIPFTCTTHLTTIL